jgi:TfoX/Sxy family transcriptional regulator of competence genes
LSITSSNSLDGTGVIARKMFGEFGLFYEGKMVGLICDNQLYVKPTVAGRTFLGDCPEGQPYPNAKLHFLIPGERWDDSERLKRLIQLTAADLPPPTKKKARKPR